MRVKHFAVAAQIAVFRGSAGLHPPIRAAISNLRTNLLPEDEGFEVELLRGLADRAFGRRDHASAVAAYREVIAMAHVLSADDMLEVVARLAESLLALRAYGQAERWFMVALGALPAGADRESYFHERLGDIHFKQLDWASAVESYTQALHREVAGNYCGSGAAAGDIVVGDAVEVLRRESEGDQSDSDGQWLMGHVAILHEGHRTSSIGSRDWGERSIDEQLCYMEGATGLREIPDGSLCVVGSYPEPTVSGEQKWTEWIKPGRSSRGYQANLVHRLPLPCKLAEAELKLSLFSSAGAADYLRLLAPPALSELWADALSENATLLNEKPSFQQRAMQLLTFAPGNASKSADAFREHGAVAVADVVNPSDCAALASYLLQFRSVHSTRMWEVAPEFRGHATYFVKSNVDRDHFALSLDEGPPGGLSVGELLRQLLGGESALAGLTGALFSNSSVLWELAAFVVHPGAAAQPVHADVQASPHARDAAARPASVTLQLLLGDASAHQGSVVVWPGSHAEPRVAGTSTAERTWAQRGAAFAAASGSPRQFSGVEMAPLGAGSIVAFHSQLWHRGGANDQALPRVVLYVSFLSGGSVERMKESADSSIVGHHLALLPEYKLHRKTLGDLL